MSAAQAEIAERRTDYRDFRVFTKRRYWIHRRKPGCVWNWRNGVPWWGDDKKLTDCEERQTP